MIEGEMEFTWRDARSDAESLPPDPIPSYLRPSAFICGSNPRSNNAGELQQAAERVRLFVAHRLARPDLLVKIQQGRAVPLAAQQPLSHEDQVVVLLTPVAGQEKLGADAIDAPHPPCPLSAGGEGE